MKDHKIPLHEKYVKRNLCESRLMCFTSIVGAAALFGLAIYANMTLHGQDSIIFIFFIFILGFQFVVAAMLYQSRSMSLAENDAIMRKLEQMSQGGVTGQVNPADAGNNIQVPSRQQLLGADEEMGHGRQVHAIGRSLRLISWLLVPLALVGTALGILLVIAGAKGEFGETPTEELKVIAARADLPAGTELSKANLGLKTISACKGPKHPVLPRYDFVIVGHKLVRPIAKGQAISWYDTDIPLPSMPDNELGP